MNINRIVEFLEDLKSEDVRKRVTSVKHLNVISDALGVEKCKTMLLPFLKEFEDDEEEVMVELAKQLLPLGKYINEGGAGVLELIPYFYIILGYEDASVVNEGFKSLEGLLKAFNVSSDAVLNLAKKLQAVQMARSQASASRICCTFSQYIPSKYSAEISKIINEAGVHKNSLVRKETATALRFLLDESTPHEALASGLIKKLLKDGQESVRVAASESICYKKFPKPYFTASFLQSVMQLFEQKSWKTKWVLAASMPNILGSIQPASRKPLLTAYSKLILDPEIEVSTKAIETLKELSSSLEPEDALMLLAVVKPAASSENIDIRKVVAKSITSLAPFCTQGSSLESLKEILNTILKDENAEVKAVLMANSDSLNKAFSTQQLSSIFTPHLLELLNDKGWKVRKEAVLAFEIIASKLGEGYFNEEKITRAVKERLADRVFEVRLGMISALKNLSVTFGKDWTEKMVLPILGSFIQNSNYLYRLSYVFGIRELLPILSQTSLLKESDFLFKLGRDNVANVKVQALVVLVKLARQVEEKSVDDRVATLVREMENDQDGDVQRVAGKCGGMSVKQLALKFTELKLI